ncbi:ribonuclease HII [bacterium]|nr:ribonuclease HII [bacterium]
MRIMGVDEAGRGPVLGPMVMGAVLAEDDTVEPFRELGVRDSKALTRKARERIFERLAGRFQIAYEIVTPADINGGRNLNELEFDRLTALAARLNPGRIIVDAFLPPAKLSARIQKKFPGVDVLAEWKADENHLIVSAASIVAKVIRDRQMDELRPAMGDVGSGYPSDPATKRWLRAELLKCRLALHRLPACVRLKWRTVANLKNEVDPPESNLNHPGTGDIVPEE